MRPDRERVKRINRIKENEYMREIKFKCFYEGKIYNVASIDFNHKKINLNGGDIIDFKDSQLMQYTRTSRY